MVRRPRSPSRNDFNVDLRAVGAGSLVAGLAGSFAVNASPPRTAVLGSAGAKSQVAGLVAVGASGHRAPGVRDQPVEGPARGGSRGSTHVCRFEAFPFRRAAFDTALRNFEFALAVITMAIVVLVGIEQGVVAAALLRSGTAHPARGAAPGTRSSAAKSVPTTGCNQTSDGPTEQLAGDPRLPPLRSALVRQCHTRRSSVSTTTLRPRLAPVHHLIVDANAVADIDYTGAKAFGEFVAECKQRGISVSLARVPNLVHHDLKHSGLLKAIGPDHLFASVEEAVASVAPAAGLPTGPAAA